MTTSEKKLAHKRLSALELAEKLGNVSEVCRRRGISRTQFYEYKRRFQTHGFAGLVDLPPIHKTHPQTTPPEVVEQVLAASLKNPMWGCHRLSAQLKLGGTEDIRSVLLELGLPLRDLVGMQFELLRQLGDGLVTLQCRQGDFGLECRTVIPAFPAHLPAPSLLSLPQEST